MPLTTEAITTFSQIPRHTSASKKYNENPLESPILQHLCGQHKKIHLKEPGRLRFAAKIPEVDVRSEAGVAGPSAAESGSWFSPLAGDIEHSSSFGDHVNRSYCEQMMHLDSSDPGRQQSSQDPETPENNQQLLSLVLKQGDMLRQSCWDTKKHLEDMEVNQRSRHAQTLESLQLLANKAKQIDERVTEEAQRATLATQHLEDQQRRTFSNVAANVHNLTIGLEKQVRNLGSAVEQLQNQEAKVIDSCAIERKQLLERLNAQKTLIDIDTEKFVEDYGDALKLGGE